MKVDIWYVIAFCSIPVIVFLVGFLYVRWKDRNDPGTPVDHLGHMMVKSLAMTANEARSFGYPVYTPNNIAYVPRGVNIFEEKHRHRLTISSTGAYVLEFTCESCLAVYKVDKHLFRLMLTGSYTAATTWGWWKQTGYGDWDD